MIGEFATHTCLFHKFPVGRRQPVFADVTDATEG